MNVHGRLMNPLSLYKKDFMELLQECRYIVEIDYEDHKNLVKLYHKLKKEDKKSHEYLERFSDRLFNAELREDYFKELIARVQCHDYLVVYAALYEASIEAKRKGQKEYGFEVKFGGDSPYLRIL